MYGVRRQFFIFWKARILLGWAPSREHPPPKPPFQSPHPDRMGTNLLLFWILHPSAYSLRPETGLLQSYGAKTEVQTPMHTWPTRHPQLTCTAPHRFHFFRILLIISCWHNPGSLKWNAASLAWLLPRPAPEHVCLWLLDVSIDPPFYPICSNKVAIDWAWAKDSNDIFKLSWKWPRNKLETSRKKLKTCYGTIPPPPGFDPGIYQSIALDFRIPNM
jgi:hypothetical protein